MPPEMVRPQYSWIKYTEPEGHLARLTADLISTCGLRQDARILGFSSLDDSMLTRFRQRGFVQTYRLEPSKDLGIQDPLAGLESAQHALTPERVDSLVSQHGLADLILARRVLEHAHAPLKLLSSLAKMLKPTGYLMIEVPDSTKFLSSCDHSFVWEEHISYFTGQTIGRLLQHSNLTSSMSRTYEYPLEDSLVEVVQPGVSKPAANTSVSAEVELAAKFGKRFGDRRQKVQADLLRLKSEGKRVAVLGAGHLAVKFVNFYHLEDLVYCVVDDNPQKLGMCLPGSGLPVRASTALMEDDIALCLLSVGPESEDKVTAAKREYLARGGRFGSIFALSPMAVWRAVT